MAIDIFLFQQINNLAGQSKILDFLGVFFAQYIQYLLAVILLALLFWPKKDRDKNRRMIAIGLLAALAARYVVKAIIILFYARPRPFLVLSDVHKLFNISISENFQSFPSGHAIFFFALSAVIFCFNKKTGIWFFAASALMAVARVFGGAHWPSDIIGGAVLGCLIGWLIFKIFKHWQKDTDAI